MCNCISSYKPISILVCDGHLQFCILVKLEEHLHFYMYAKINVCGCWYFAAYISAAHLIEIRIKAKCIINGRLYISVMSHWHAHQVLLLVNRRRRRRDLTWTQISLFIILNDSMNVPSALLKRDVQRVKINLIDY